MPKILKSKKMRGLLIKAMRKSRKVNGPPGDGSMLNLIYERLQNGWHYQVEWIHDTRFAPRPWIEVFAFAPWHKGVATHSLRSDQEGRK